MNIHLPTILLFSVLGACGTSSPKEAFEVGENTLTQRQQPVGLSVLLTNGASEPITLIQGSKHHLQEVDISEQVTTAGDEGIAPLIGSAATQALNWQGVELVEEQWIPALDGTFTRERYYRHAQWMEAPSRFKLQWLDHRGRPVGVSLRFQAGTDDRWARSDDGFVRRFVARQLAVGCAAVGQCDGARFVAEALVQVRSATHARARAQLVPKRAAHMKLTWSALPGQPYTIPLVQAKREEVAWGYGFSVDLEEVSQPPNGLFYQPGDAVHLRMVFRDGQGERLHQPGALPTYAAVATGADTSGLQYLDLALPTRLYYALKHRESNLMVGISGPLDELRSPQTVVDPTTFFLPQTQFAFASVDGYTSVLQTVPPAAIIFGGLQDPSVWEAPVSDVVTFTIPTDAQPGTYIAALKARRSYAGEALNRGATLRLQVGQGAGTEYVPDTACVTCHTAPGAKLEQALHGIDDRASCFTCHSSLAIEFDNALDVRVHRVHALSDRFPANIMDCSTCHVEPPTAPARGL